jgi:hypothetical protein
MFLRSIAFPNIVRTDLYQVNIMLHVNRILRPGRRRVS